jgi:cytochrome c biogenesis factor
MNEKALLELWNQKRSQIITAQMAPTLVLIAILVVSSLGYFADASDSAKVLAIGVAAATGILAVISQYAAIREAKALIADINKVDKPSALAKKIGESDVFLALTAIAIVALSLAIFGLVIWTVLA